MELLECFHEVFLMYVPYLFANCPILSSSVFSALTILPGSLLSGITFSTFLSSCVLHQGTLVWGSLKGISPHGSLGWLFYLAVSSSGSSCLRFYLKVISPHGFRGRIFYLAVSFLRTLLFYLKCIPPQGSLGWLSYLAISFLRVLLFDCSTWKVSLLMVLLDGCSTWLSPSSGSLVGLFYTSSEFLVDDSSTRTFLGSSWPTFLPG